MAAGGYSPTYFGRFSQLIPRVCTDAVTTYQVGTYNVVVTQA